MERTPTTPWWASSPWSCSWAWWSSSSGWPGSQFSQRIRPLRHRLLGPGARPVRGRRGALQRHQGRRGHRDRARPHRPQPGRSPASASTSDVPVRIDSYATLEPQGITGVNYIQITAGTRSKPLLKDARSPATQVPVIRSQRSAMSDLLEGGGTVLARTIEALDRRQPRAVRPEHQDASPRTLADVQAVTAELRERKAIIADAQTRHAAASTQTAPAIQQLAESADQTGQRRRQADPGEPRRRRRGAEGRRPRRAQA